MGSVTTRKPPAKGIELNFIGGRTSIDADGEFRMWMTDDRRYRIVERRKRGGTRFYPQMLGDQRMERIGPSEGLTSFAAASQLCRERAALKQQLFA